jgi:hypothetical protein
VVGLEPSCAAVFRSDAAELFPATRTWPGLKTPLVTLAELLGQRTPGWQPPRLDREALSRCTATSTPCLGDDADLALMREMGESRPSASTRGCCGLAGNFGFQPGHPPRQP